MEERETVKSADGGRISRLTTRRPYPLCLSTGRKCARWIKRLIRGILPLISTMDERIIELSIVIEFESIYYKKKEEKEKRERERERKSPRSLRRERIEMEISIFTSNRMGNWGKFHSGSRRYPSIPSELNFML